MLADLSWPEDPLPVPSAPVGSADWWRWMSRETLAARTNPEVGCFPDGDLDPAPDADEWQDCPDDDAYTYTEQDLRNYEEEAMDTRVTW